jgi:hypothetical protein
MAAATEDASRFSTMRHPTEVAWMAVVEAMADLTNAPPISDAIEVGNSVSADIIAWLRRQPSIRLDDVRATDPDGQMPDAPREEP